MMQQQQHQCYPQPSTLSVMPDLKSYDLVTSNRSQVF